MQALQLNRLGASYHCITGLGPGLSVEKNVNFDVKLAFACTSRLILLLLPTGAGTTSNC